MIYFIPVFVLLFFFETLGTVFLKKNNFKKLKYNSATGFILFSSMFFIFVCPILYFQLDHIFLFIIGTILIFLSLTFIIINYKLIEYNFDLWIVVVIVLVTYGLYKALNTTLGPNNYDSSFYINYVSSIIGTSKLNGTELSYGYSGKVTSPYFYQTYYHLSAYFVWAFQSIYSIFKITYYVMPGYIWMMSTLFLAFFAEAIVNFINKFKIRNLFLLIFIILFVGFFFEGMHWNNSLAFFGNTYRTLITTYFVYYLYCHLNNHNQLKLLFISSLCLISVSSTSLYIIIIVLYGLLFVDYKNNKNIFKEISILSVIPLSNLYYIVSGKDILKIYVVIIIIFLIVYLLNDYLVNIVRKFNLLTILLYLVPFILLIFSFRITGNLFDFSSFFNTLSGKADMTWEYFRYYDILHILINITIYILFITYLLFTKESKIKIFFLIVIFTFFNPFTVSIISDYIKVYYRAYDILINPFTLILFCSVIDRFKNDIYKNLISIILLILIIYPSTFYFYSYDRENLIPDSINYNKLYKMENDEIDMILEVTNIIKENNMKDVKVYLNTLYFRAYNPEAFNLRNRFMVYRSPYENDKELFSILYQSTNDFSSNSNINDLDYDNLFNIILKSQYDFVSDNKNIDIFTSEGYYQKRYKLLEYIYPNNYQNDTYYVVRTFINE